MEKHNVCIVIPSYNNAKTLRRVLEGVLRYPYQVLVVNDGSTDDTAAILTQYPSVTTITHPKNQGKGKALQTGFEQARAMGYDYALTLDSDGQHYPEDIPIFIEALAAEEAPVLLVGNRDMQQEGVPKKSSFGHRFSNFWFRLETGVALPDTQSGFRLYPLHFIPKKYYTRKFEFEIEILVRSSWRGIAVKPVPIRVLYDPAERVSHFRPFRDFTRISILNTVLVVLTFLYIKPRNFFREARQKSFKQFVKENILESDSSKEVKACSVALGVFFGIAPFWGLQTVLTIALAVFFRLNKTLAFICSNVSIPPMIPILILASLKIGAFITGGQVLPEGEINMDYVKSNLLQYLVGSMVLAITAAVVLGGATYLLLKKRQK